MYDYQKDNELTESFEQRKGELVEMLNQLYVYANNPVEEITHENLGELSYLVSSANDLLIIMQDLSSELNEINKTPSRSYTTKCIFENRRCQHARNYNGSFECVAPSDSEMTCK